jgi:hypothetical protein
MKETESGRYFTKDLKFARDLSCDSALPKQLASVRSKNIHTMKESDNADLNTL